MQGNNDTGRISALQVGDAARRGRDRHGRQRGFALGRDPGELVGQHRIEVRVGLKCDLLNGLIHRERRPARHFGRQMVEHLGNADDSCQQGNTFALKAMRVT